MVFKKRNAIRWAIYYHKNMIVKLKGKKDGIFMTVYLKMKKQQECLDTPPSIR